MNFQKQKNNSQNNLNYVKAPYKEQWIFFAKKLNTNVGQTRKKSQVTLDSILNKSLEIISIPLKSVDVGT